jgi:tetratricopeptide (TPR) repeat protein
VLPQLRRHAAVWTDAIKSLREAARQEQIAGYGNMRAATAELRRGPMQAASDLLADERFDEAIVEARKVAKTDKDYIYALLTRAHAHRRLGHREAARSLLDEGAALTKRLCWLWVEQATILLECGQPEAAAAAARTALEPQVIGTEGQKFDAWSLLVRALARAGAVDEARGAMHEWASAHPTDVRVTLACGRLLAELDRREEALDLLDQALAMGPLEEADLIDAIGWTARLRRESGDLVGARRDLEVGLDLTGHHPGLHLNLAWLELADGKPNAALRAAVRARELTPDKDTDMLFWIDHCIGTVRCALGQHREALPLLERHLARYPDDEHVRARLAECRDALAPARAVFKAAS